MSIENENRMHAALGLSFAPGQMIVRVCNGVLLHTIEQIAPGIIECELAEGLGDGEAVVSVSSEPPPAPFVVAVIMRTRLSATRWRFGTFRAAEEADFGPVGFDVVWFRAATGGGPVAVVPVP